MFFPHPFHTRFILAGFAKTRLQRCKFEFLLSQAFYKHGMGPAADICPVKCKEVLGSLELKSYRKTAD